MRAMACFVKAEALFFMDFGCILLLYVIRYSGNQDCPFPDTKDNTEIPRQLTQTEGTCEAWTKEYTKLRIGGNSPHSI